jgi:hypothetical protein
MGSTLRDQLIAAGIIHISSAEAQPVLHSSRLHQPHQNDVELGHHRASFQRRTNSIALETKSEISLPPPANHSHIPIDRAATPNSTTPASHSISTAANVSLPGITGDIHLPPPAHYAPLPIDSRPWKGPPAPAPVPPTPPLQDRVPDDTARHSKHLRLRCGHFSRLMRTSMQRNKLSLWGVLCSTAFQRRSMTPSI